MIFRRYGKEFCPLAVFRVNESTILAVYEGAKGPLDILIRYRQKFKKGKWSAIRTPKHIHWTVDILMKMQSYRELTEEFLDFFIALWGSTVPIRNNQERESLNLEALLYMNNQEIERFKELSRKGEYSVRFLILLAKLLMLQEKTNRPDAYMFKRVLDGLREGKDLFRVLATASLTAKRNG